MRKLQIILMVLIGTTGCHTIKQKIDALSNVQPKLHSPTPVARLLSTNIIELINSAKNYQRTNSAATLEKVVAAAEGLHNRRFMSSEFQPSTTEAVTNLVTSAIQLQDQTNSSGTNSFTIGLTKFISSLYEYYDYPTNNAVPSNSVTAYMQIASDDDVAEEFGTTFGKCFYVGEVVIQNPNTNSFLAYSSSLQVEISYYVAESDWQKVRTNMLARFKKEYILDKRRPATYSDILAIFEYQRQSNWRQQFINYFESAGEIAAGAGVFVGGAAYPKAVAFATGVIEPELQKRLLWDILLNAKNLEARSLKEVEEVPAGGSIHRVVFFPKRGVPGVLDGYLVYISSFKPWQPILISGSLIQKTATTTSIPGIPADNQ